MNDELDTLLRQDLLAPPEGFSFRVMQGIKPLPLPFAPAAPRRSKPSTAQALRRLALRLGLIGAGLLGLSQVASFVFGVWLASSAL
jgi:hypothetical protein